MSEIRRFSAIIFDLDGLVLDTEITYIHAWQQAAMAMGFTLSDHFCQTLSGLHHHDVEAKLLSVGGSNLDLSVFHKWAGRYWRDYVQDCGIPIKPGVRELLVYLQENAVPVALATNSRASNVQECLALAGLEGAFPLQATRDDVAMGKPEPDVFHHAAALLDTSIKDCWVLEDSLPGIIAAHRAGAFSVLVPSLAPVDAQAIALSDLHFPDLHDVLATIRAQFP